MAKKRGRNNEVTDYEGGRKAGFHCILPFSQRFCWQSLVKLYDPPMAGTACWIKVFHLSLYSC